MKKKLLLALGICVLTLTGCGKVPKLENGQEIVASIDGYDLTADDLYEALKKQGGINIVVNKIDEAIVKAEIKDSDEGKEYAQKQIDNLKAQYDLYKMDFNEALKQAGYENEDELKNEIMIDYNKGIVVKNYLSDNLSEDEINTYYENEIYGEMTVKHILIKPETTDDMTADEKKEAEQKALDKAKDLIKQIKDGADFEKLAKENSADAGTASQGGLFTNFTKEGVVPEFFEASLKLKDGEYTTTPVKTTYGYHIILKVSQNEKPSLEKVLDDIKEKIVDNKLEEDQTLSVITWDEVRKKHNLSINDTKLKDKYDEIIKSYKK